MLLVPPLENSAKLHFVKEMFQDRKTRRQSLRIKAHHQFPFTLHLFVKEKLPVGLRSMSPDITRVILEESNRHGVDPLFVASMIEAESNFHPKARGLAGEIGLMQLMPSTAEWLLQLQNKEAPSSMEEYLENPIKNVSLGIYYLSLLREQFENKATYFVPAYNMGPGKLAQFVEQKKIPKEYMQRIFKNYQRLLQTPMFVKLSTVSKKS